MSRIARATPIFSSSKRIAGLKGGEARAESLTPEQRRKIASTAARARWHGFDGREWENEPTIQTEATVLSKQ